jgi:cation transport regulator ChaC
MKSSYLEVTFRRGRPLAAYFYLPRCPNDRSHRTAKAEPGLVIDFNRAGTPIGIEITAPAKVSTAGLNRVLRQLGFPPVTRAELVPLRAA